MDNYIGKKIEGRYLVNELIGVGGMPIQRDSGRRSRPGVNPFISALTVARCPATFPGVWPQLRDTLSTSWSGGRGTGRCVEETGFHHRLPMQYPICNIFNASFRSTTLIVPTGPFPLFFKTIAVSYTHLDVYKRQVQLRRAHHPRAAGEGASDRGCLHRVSYTHLEVYKRQACSRWISSLLKSRASSLETMVFASATLVPGCRSASRGPEKPRPC